MRKANVNDMFDIARLISDIGIKEELFLAQHDTEDVEKIGFMALFNIFDKAISKGVQDKVYNVLSGPFEINPEDVGKLEIDELFTLFNECFNINTLVNFIKRAQSIMN